MNAGLPTTDGYDVMTQTIKRMSELEEQHQQAQNRVEAYRQLLVSALEGLPVGQRINIEGRDLLTILADDIYQS